MKRGRVILFLVIYIALSQIFLFSKNNEKNNEKDKKEDISSMNSNNRIEDRKVDEGAKMLIDRMKWFFEGRQGPDGFIPHNARLNALRQMEENIRKGILAAEDSIIPGNLWSPIGPAPLYSGSTAYSGRVSTIAAANSNTIYVGAAQGGVWKTTTGGPPWTPLTDNQASLASGSIAIAASNPNIIYVGTGESNFSCDSYFGAGILKSTDGGNTWSLLGQSTFSNTSISKIIIHPTNPNILWAANTRGTGGFICYVPSGTYGVWKSIDGGNTWTLVLGSGQTGVISYTTDLAISNTDPNVIYAGVRESGIWKTTDGGTTWTKLGGGLPTTNIGVIDLAIDPNNNNIIYATYEALSTGQHLNIYKSTDSGINWAPINKPANLCSSYCWYCMFIEVAPDGNVWLGGIYLYRSSNGGSTWTNVSNSGLHVDQHAIAFPGDGSVWIGNDGGVFKTANNGSSWQNLNVGLYTVQFYPGTSLHPTNANLGLGGTQDNGTLKYTGTTSWTEIYGGDGAFSSIDFTNPDNVWYVSYQYLNILKSTNGGTSFSSATTGLTDANTSNAPFIAPYVMCPNNANVLIAGSDNVWRTNNGAANWSSNSPDPLDLSNSKIRAIAFAASDTSCNTYFVGLQNGKIFRTTVGGGSSGWVEITGTLPSRGINDIAVHPTNANIVYLAFSGFGGPHVYKTTNALDPAPVWNAIDTGIPDIPVNAILLDPTDPNVVYIGTDIGIFRSTDAGSSWQSFNNGHPRVAVFDLVADDNPPRIFSFTHGRSAFTLSTAPPGEVPMKNGSGNPLLITKSGNNLILSWSAPGGNCIPTDYGIYRGNIGEYYSHTQIDCYDDGPDYLQETIPSDVGSYYFIIVARTDTVEGSYGKNSNGTERPVGITKCVANQNLNPC